MCDGKLLPWIVTARMLGKCALPTMNHGQSKQQSLKINVPDNPLLEGPTYLDLSDRRLVSFKCAWFCSLTTIRKGVGSKPTAVILTSLY